MRIVAINNGATDYRGPCLRRSQDILCPNNTFLSIYLHPSILWANCEDSQGTKRKKERVKVKGQAV